MPPLPPPGLSRRGVVLGGLGGIAACAGAPEKAAPPPEAAPPDPLEPRPNGRAPTNVLVVLVDDQRWDMLGFLGHPFLRTPSLDRLAKEGTHHAEAFVTTSLCCPSRASFLTGLYAHAHGVLDNRAELSPALPTWSRLAERAGVDTALFGKWHMGAPNPHPRPGWKRWVAFGGQGTYEPGADPRWSFDGELRPVSGYTTDAITEHAEAWLREPERRQRPFAAVVSHKAVHAPFVPAERHRSLYAEVPVPETLPDTDAAYAQVPAWLRAMRRGSEFGVERPYRQWPDFASWYRDYHRTLLAVDEGVGRLLAALEDQGLLATTAVLYTSDNGFMVGEKGVLDKRNAYESSIRVPLIVRRPGAAPGVSRDPVLNVDLAPTVLDLLGLQPPAECHGRSLLELGQGKPWRQEFVYEYFHERMFPDIPTLFALRTRRAKLITTFGFAQPDELYDLERDPGETRNLAELPEHAEQRRAMEGRMRKKLRALGLLDQPVWGRRWVADPSAVGEDEPEEAAEPEE